MSQTWHAVGIGLRRGWIMFTHVVTTADGILNTVIWNGIPLVILVLNRDEIVEGTGLSLPVFALPGFLGLLIAASAIGPAYYIAAEREDGTVLRAKAIPNGIVGYVTGVLTQASLETLLGVALILVPGFILFEGLLIGDPVRWLGLRDPVVGGSPRRRQCARRPDGPARGRARIGACAPSPWAPTGSLS